MVENACNSMYIYVEADSSDQMISLSEFGGEGGDFIKINKFVNENNFDYIILMIEIGYNSYDERADGDFTVDFPDISLEFTSVPPTA